MITVAVADPSRYRIGCTGWGYDDWRGGFYPPGTDPKEYLSRYAKVFDLTEVDSAYYRGPDLAQTARWAQATPPGFLFTTKFPGDITHKARLRGVEEPLDRFLASLQPLRRADKLGPLLLQLPPSFRRDRDAQALHDFLTLIPRAYQLAVELRHESWWVPETYRMLEDAGATLVWSTTEYGRTPAVRTSDLVYARLIGDRALTRFDRVQRDQRPEMDYWKARFEEQGEGARKVYAFVNNHLMGFAPGAAAILHQVLGLPEPDLGAARRDPGQRSLF